jgi:hypothetical protein
LRKGGHGSANFTGHWVLTVLNNYADTELSRVRAAAANGDKGAVDDFTARVMQDLGQRTREWLIVQEKLSEAVVAAGRKHMTEGSTPLLARR